MTPPVLIAALGGIVLLAGFVLIEARGRDPLMPLRLLRNRQLRGGITITFIFMATFGAVPYFLTVALFATMDRNGVSSSLDRNRRRHSGR